MVSWDYLIECIERLEKLDNGSGTEIEFSYQGVEYCIVSYGKYCDIEKLPEVSFDGGRLTYSDETLFTYQTLRELSKATDIGFCLEDVWPDISGLNVRPDFISYPFDEIYKDYEEALNRRKR